MAPQSSAKISRVVSTKVPEPAPGTWSNCLTVNGVAYVAGMIARGEDGKIVAGDEYDQAKAIFAKIRHLIEAAGGSMMSDEAGQIEMWKKTGGPPPNIKLWPKLAAEDKDFAALKHAVFDQTPITHSAYYFAEWPAVHKAYSDMAIAALSGKREDIPKVLAAHVDKIRNAATGK